MVTFQWVIRPEDVWPDLAQTQIDAIEADLVAMVDGMTDEVAAWMRDNARWNDQTGEARAGLYADIETVARRSVDLIMSHGPAISYSWWLETVNSGRYSVLPDAVDNWAPRLLREAREIVARHSS